MTASSSCFDPTAAFDPIDRNSVSCLEHGWRLEALHSSDLGLISKVRPFVSALVTLWPCLGLLRGVFRHFKSCHKKIPFACCINMEANPNPTAGAASGWRTLSAVLLSLWSWLKAESLIGWCDVSSSPKFRYLNFGCARNELQRPKHTADWLTRQAWHFKPSGRICTLTEHRNCLPRCANLAPCERSFKLDSQIKVYCKIRPLTKRQNAKVKPIISGQRLQPLTHAMDHRLHLLQCCVCGGSVNLLWFVSS